MKNLKKQLSAIVLSTMFATMQISFASSIGLNNADLNSYTGGYAGLDSASTAGNATLNFTGNSHLNWNTLNVGKGETLNFNAINGKTGLTVLNTVNQGMSTFAGNVNANSGISKLIISNPNGMLFDGAQFTTAADSDLILTTKDMTAVNVNSLTDGNYTKLYDASNGLIPIEIKNNSAFNVGGNFTIYAPQAALENSVVTANTLKLITANGQDYQALGAITPVNNKGVAFLKAMTVNGDVVITNDAGAMAIYDGGTINGDLKISSAGNTLLNFIPDTTNGVTQNATAGKLVINGDVDITTDGVQTFLRDAKVNNLDVKSSGGFIDVGDTTINGNANLKTTGTGNNKTTYNHFVHVIGDTHVTGDLNIDSSQNIHIGGYDYAAEKLADGNLKVDGTLDAHSRGGHVTTTINTQADKINYTSDTHNILTDDKAVLTANEYNFKSNGYIGGIQAYTSGDTTISPDSQIVSIMENYTFIPKDIQSHAYTKIAGGEIKMIENPANSEVYIASNGDVKLTGADAGNINLTAYRKRIDIEGPNVHAKNINIGNETDILKVEFPGRDYTLNYTNIRDGQVKTINKNDVITYELTDEPTNGYNSPTLTPSENTTYLVGPGTPPPPGPTPPEPTPPQPNPPQPEDNDNAKLLHNNWAPDDVTAAPVNTPVAFAADLDDDDLDRAVRKNVDGSVTVVRAFPMY